MSRTTTRPIPESVRTRKRLVLAGDIALGVIVLCIPFSFALRGIAMALWALAALVFALVINNLRRTIDALDLSRTSMDEYQLTQHMEARNDGLRAANIMAATLFVAGGVAIFLTVNKPVLSAAALSHALAIYAYLMLPLPSFIVARSMAGKLNRDELISQE